MRRNKIIFPGAKSRLVAIYAILSLLILHGCIPQRLLSLDAQIGEHVNMEDHISFGRLDKSLLSLSFSPIRYPDKWNNLEFFLEFCKRPTELN